jgi:hypothetical protein
VFLNKNGELTDGLATSGLSRVVGLGLSSHYTLYTYNEIQTDNGKQYLTFKNTLNRLVGKTRKLASKLLAPSSIGSNIKSTGMAVGKGIGTTINSMGRSFGRTVGRKSGVYGGKRRTLKKRSKK